MRAGGIRRDLPLEQLTVLYTGSLHGLLRGWLLDGCRGRLRDCARFLLSGVPGGGGHPSQQQMKVMKILMKRPLQLILPTFLAVTATITPAAAQAPRRMTYREAVTTAVDTGPQVKISSAGVEASQARASSASRQRFPVLRVEGNIQYWNKPLDVVFVATAPGMPWELWK